MPAVYAVGDVRSDNITRVASAVGEGSIAIVFVQQVLREQAPIPASTRFNDWFTIPEDRAMRILAFPLAGLASCLIATTSALTAQATTVTPLLAKPLPDIPGKEVLVITVEYAPGAADSVHRHNAHAVIYVLEGSIVMQLKGGKQVTLYPGETFYEGPDDIHAVGRNASSTRPAKFLVFFLKRLGSPPLVPVP